MPFAVTGAGIARQGNPVVGGGVVDLRHDVAEPRLRDRHGVPAGRPRGAGTEIEIDVRGKARTAEVREKPLYSKEN